MNMWMGMSPLGCQQLSGLCVQCTMGSQDRTVDSALAPEMENYYSFRAANGRGIKGDVVTPLGSGTMLLASFWR